MIYRVCEDCGTKMNNGYCPNCNEEIFIAEQYRELDEPVPQSIADKEMEQRENPALPHKPKYK